MPEYKKKKRSRFEKPHKKQKIVQNPEIKASQDGVVREEKLKVVRGKKANYKKRFAILGGILAAVILFITIYNFFYPAGVVEGFKNSMALIGSGSYPKEFSNSRVIDVKSRDSYYFVLTSKQLKGYSNSGKELFSHTHGFENPMLKISQSRTLIFDQGSTRFCIFTLSGLVLEKETENSILNANIADSGSYVIATQSENYASAVSVYSKEGERIYEWFSAEDIVNNVALDYDGEKVAVSTFNANTGKYKSQLKILNYSSPKAEYTKTYNDTVIYALDSTFRGSLAVVTQNEIFVTDWSGEETKAFTDDYAVSMFRSQENFVAVFNRESDKTDNKIVVLNDEGETEATLSFSGIISDIAVNGEHIYCISDSKVYILNFKGKLIRQTKCGFGSIRTVITDSSTALVISDDKIEKIELERE